MVRKPKSENSSFLPVEGRRLIVDAKLPFDIFVEEDDDMTLFFKRGTILKEEDRKLLISQGITTIHVKKQEKMILDHYLSTERQKRIPTFYEDLFAFRNYSLNKEGYFQIDKASLILGETINFSLYALNNMEISQIAICSGESPLVIDKSLQQPDSDIIIRKTDIARYENYIDTVVSRRYRTQVLPTKEKTKILLKNLLENPFDNFYFKDIFENVNKLIETILQDSDTIYKLLSLQNKSYYPYTHSVNVAILSIALGISTGLGRNELEKLGIGALLHDIGKSVVSHEILNKQGNLTGAEYSILKMHVAEGEKILQMYDEMPRESLVPVLQHHEKLSGRGYPLKLAGSEIKIAGRITAIADCYDKLLSQLPFSPSNTPFNALGIIARDTGDYDPELLKVFIKLLGNFK